MGANHFLKPNYLKMVLFLEEGDHILAFDGGMPEKISSK